MPELFGPAPHVTLSSTLWLVPLSPLVGCLVHLLGGRRLRTNLRARVAAATLFVTASLAVSLFEAARLAALPNEARHLYQHGWQMVRTGSVSFDFDLALDPLSAALVLLLLLAGAFVLLREATSSAPTPTPHLLAVTHGALAATSLVLLADGFLPLAIGWGLLALPAWFAVGARARGGAIAAARRAFVVGKVGDVALLIGAALLLWGLGGAWLAEGVYQPDALARLVAVRAAEPPADERPGDLAERAPVPVSTIRQAEPSRLTLTAMPGGRVLLDGREIERSPFVGRVVEAGLHTVRVLPGGADDDYEVANFRAVPHGETTIALLGPSLSFREIGDQLPLRDRDGASMRGRLLERRLFGVGLASLACALFFVAAAAKSAEQWLLRALTQATHRTGAAAALARALPALAGPYLLARLSCSFELPAGPSSVVTLGSALVGWFVASRLGAVSDVVGAALLRLARAVGAFDRGIVAPLFGLTRLAGKLTDRAARTAGGGAR